MITVNLEVNYINNINGRINFIQQPVESEMGAWAMMSLPFLLAGRIERERIKKEYI